MSTIERKENINYTKLLEKGEVSGYTEQQKRKKLHYYGENSGG